MSKFRTHYDTLKVSRDAPIEVIQAAYRSLARKYHPDTNGGNPQSETIMQEINAAYEVLEDPVKRARHDEWITAQSRAGGPMRPPRANDHAPSGGRGPERKTPPRQWTLFDGLLAISYFASAFYMFRIPSLRILGMIMLIAGWLFLRSRSRSR